jgi:hypothetical protein
MLNIPHSLIMPGSWSFVMIMRSCHVSGKYTPVPNVFWLGTSASFLLILPKWYCKLYVANCYQWMNSLNALSMIYQIHVYTYLYVYIYYIYICMYMYPIVDASWYDLSTINPKPRSRKIPSRMPPTATRWRNPWSTWERKRMTSIAIRPRWRSGCVCWVAGGRVPCA